MTQIEYQRSFRTDRLNIRAIESTDAPRLFAAYANDPEVARYMAWKYTGRISDTQKFVDASIDTWNGVTNQNPHFGYAIELINHGDLIGAIGFRPQGFHAAIGYNLAKSHWGCGYASEAVAALTDYLLGLEPIFRVWALHDVDNPASGRVLQKCGFLNEGLAKRISIHPNISPQPRDCWIWAKTK